MCVDYHPEVVSACCSVETGFLNPIPSSQDLGGVVVLHIFALLLRSVLWRLVTDAILLLTVPVFNCFASVKSSL